MYNKLYDIKILYDKGYSFNFIADMHDKFLALIMKTWL